MSIVKNARFTINSAIFFIESDNPEHCFIDSEYNVVVIKSSKKGLVLSDAEKGLRSSDFWSKNDGGLLESLGQAVFEKNPNIRLATKNHKLKIYKCLIFQNIVSRVS